MNDMKRDYKIGITTENGVECNVFRNAEIIYIPNAGFPEEIKIIHKGGEVYIDYFNLEYITPIPNLEYITPIPNGLSYHREEK